MTILSEHFNKYGGKVEYNTELKTLEQYDDHVVAHLVNTRNGTEIKEDVRVSYLVGADGGHGEFT
jgi:2-polyprenyl-6-methoxyphenol hydroxylase-like FAD-dependent oxidoreductase